MTSSMSTKNTGKSGRRRTKTRAAGLLRTCRMMRCSRCFDGSRLRSPPALGAAARSTGRGAWRTTNVRPAAPIGGATKAAVGGIMVMHTEARRPHASFMKMPSSNRFRSCVFCTSQSDPVPRYASSLACRGSACLTPGLTYQDTTVRASLFATTKDLSRAAEAVITLLPLILEARLEGC